MYDLPWDVDLLLAVANAGLGTRCLEPAAAGHVRTILSYWAAVYPGAPEAQLAYVLATVLAEVGTAMAPVRETFAPDDTTARARLVEKPYVASAPPFGHSYYGRGYVQLTWAENYLRMAARLRLPLLAEPDLALVPRHATRLLVEGMMAGDYNPTGHPLRHYICEAHIDFVAARNTVNLQNRAEPIAEDAEVFARALRAARLSD